MGRLFGRKNKDKIKIENIVNEKDSNNSDDNKLDVIGNAKDIAISNNNKVISIKDIPSQFDMNIVKDKSYDVIRRVNLMIKNNSNNINVSDSEKVREISVSDKIKNIMTSNRFSMTLLILIFVFVCITVGKTVALRSKVEENEVFFEEIVKKEETIAKVYQSGKLELDGDSGKGAALKLVKCINSSIDLNNLPDSIESIIDEINSFYNKSNNYFAFKYKDIYTGFSISYNENQKIFAASTIKAPKDIYIYEMASLGKINLDDKLTYTSGYYNNGTGILKDKKVNTVYDVRTLVGYSTRYSDNAAHNMLMDKYGRDNMLSFWRDKGTKTIFTSSNNWGNISAYDAAIYMDELYRFYLENEEYGEELMNNFIGATTKFITGKNNYKVANKSGWSGSAMHDVSIVFADNPYIVIALSNLGQTDSYWEYFNKVNDLAYRLHTEYWKYKMNICNDIDQY